MQSAIFYLYMRNTESHAIQRLETERMPKSKEKRVNSNKAANSIDRQHTDTVGVTIIRPGTNSRT